MVPHNSLSMAKASNNQLTQKHQKPCPDDDASRHHLIDKGPAQRPLLPFLSPASATAVISQQTRPTRRNLPVTPLNQQTPERKLTPARPHPLLHAAVRSSLKLSK